METVAITLDDELARWLGDQAVDQNIPLSDLIVQPLEREKQARYWRAYEQWKMLDIKLDASQRFTRDEAHERR